MNIQFHNKNTVFDYTQLPENGVYPLMCHSPNVLVINSREEAIKIEPRTVQADAVVTTSDEVLLVMPAADCAPIVLIDHVHGVLAMMHCGWKPTLRGLIENSLESMQKLGAKIEHIHAIIGPSIEVRSFECRKDMMELFLKQNKDNNLFFTPKTVDTWGFDLKLFCQVRLYSLGIEHIETSKIDTFSHPEYHSYRKYCHKFGQDFNLSQQNGAFMNLNQASL